MKNRKNRNIIIAGLACLLVFMGVGYAILSTTLSIKGSASLAGKWEVYIDSIEATTTSGTARSDVPQLTQDKLGATFSAQLGKPGDYVEYTIVVKNNGTIPAVLTELKPNISGENIQDIILTHTMIHGQILKGETSTTFTLRVLYDDRATELVQNATATFDIELLYTQWDGNEENIDLTTQPVTANDCFTIDDSGTITKYNSLCGTYVTIPEKVNGITVTKISEAAFKSYDASIYTNESTGKMIFVVNNTDKYSAIQTFVSNGIEAGDFEQGSIQIAVPGKDTYDLTGFAYESGANFTSAGALDESSVIANVEYLDLSQASGLKEIETYAFTSSTDANGVVLKYLNVYGLKLEQYIKMESIFENAKLEELTVDSNILDKVTDGITVNKLRVLKGTSTSVQISAQCTANTYIIGEGITVATGLPHNVTNITVPSTITDISKLVYWDSLKTTTNKVTITMNHRKKPSFYDDTSWYNANNVTVNWPYLAS